jgi:hypothetical protein
MTKYTPLSYTFVQIFTILLIVAIRTLAVKYHWQILNFMAMTRHRKCNYYKIISIKKAPESGAFLFYFFLIRRISLCFSY